jgi:UTP--glucose-1-phosphate uridylyltransferase
LRDRGKVDELAQIKTISELASVAYVRQKEPRGLGQAILCAKPLVGDEPACDACSARVTPERIL